MLALDEKDERLRCVDQSVELVCQKLASCCKGVDENQEALIVMVVAVLG